MSSNPNQNPAASPPPSAITGISEAIFDSAPVGLVAFRADGQCVQVNQAAERIMQAPRAALLAQNVFHLDTWQRSGLAQAARQALAGAGPQVVEVHTLNSFGKEVWLLCRITAFQLEGQPHFLLISEDICAQRQAEQALARRSARQAAVAELTHALAESSGDLRRTLDEAASLIGSELGDMTILTLADPSSQVLRPAAIHGRSPAECAAAWQLLEANPFQLASDWLARQAATTGRPVRMANLQLPEQRRQINPAYHAILDELQAGSLLIAPQYYQSLAVGGLLSLRRAGQPAFDDEDAEFAQLMAERTALAIANARLAEANRRHQAELEQRVAERTAALQQSENSLRSLLDALPDAAALIAPDGTLLNANQAAAASLRRPLAEALGLNLFKLFPPELVEMRRAHAMEAVETRQQVIFEEHLGERLLITRIRPVIDSSGAVQALAVLATNVSAYRQALQDLEQSRQMLRLVLDTIPQGVFWKDLQLRYQGYNRAFMTDARFASLEEGLGHDDVYFWPKNGPTYMADDRAVIESGQPRLYYEESQVTALGKFRALRTSKLPLRGPDGSVIGVIGIYEDITAQKLLEEEARLNSERLRATFEQAAVGITHTDLQRRYLLVNPGFCQITGYSQAELLGRTFMEITHPDDLPQDQAISDRIRHNDLTTFSEEKRYLRKDGRVVWVNVTSNAVHNADGSLAYFVNIIEDISARKAAEQELQQSRQMLQLVLDTIPQRVFWKDRQLRYLGYNLAFMADAGWTRPDEGLGHDDAFFWPQHAPAYQASDRAVIESGQAKLVHEDGQIISTGQPRKMRTYKLPLRGPDGSVIGVLGMYEDITAQVELEEAVRLSNERFRVVFEQAPIGIGINDREGRYVHANRSLCQLTGYTEAELLQRSYLDITFSEDVRADQALDDQLLSGKIPAFTLEKRYLRKDGRPVWINLTVALIRDADGEPLYRVGIVEDISERRAAQALLEERTRELARSNADLEQFAYTAAHDLQEPLRAVSSFTRLLERRYRTQLDATAGEYIDFITSGADYMRQLLDDLLAYARVDQRGRNFSSVGMEAALAQALANLQLPREASEALITHDPLPEVQGDELQLVELLQGLLENALKFRSSERPHIHVSARRSAAEWLFSVRDNGIGIERQYFERIFIIFQRLHLQEEYPGTGVGLAICKKIVERHGGRIWVDSEPGVGSTFYFTLAPNQADLA